MKVPSRSFALAGDKLVCEPRTKSAGVVQMHVVKHPFGVNGLARGGAWDDEGWTELGVVDDRVRAASIASILGLRHGRLECAVPELRGAQVSNQSHGIACETCPTPLAEACAAVTAPTVTRRYFAVLEELLTAASEPRARAVPSNEVGSRLVFAALRQIDRLRDVVVGYAGLDARSKRNIVVRLNRGDGVRAEFFFEEPNQLSWRTLYRDPGAVRTPNALVQFLGEAPPQGGPTMPLSEFCLVSRPFWEKP